MKIKTSELTSAALDWAVAKCEGNCITFDEQEWPSGLWEMYSTNWSQGGPIIERVDIDVFGCLGSYRARLAQHSKHPTRNVRSRFPSDGSTKLIAAMRCYVASKLGDKVDVPKELL